MAKHFNSKVLANGKPLNRMNDVFAKFIFANEARKDLTLDLINSVFELDGTKEIVDFDFRDRELDSNREDGRGIVLDVTGKCSDGTLVNVEFQLHKLDGMEQRMLYYWSLLYGRRLVRSEEYTALNHTVVISILAYRLFDDEVWPHYHSSFAVLNTKDMNHKLTDDLEIHFVELPKWKRKPVSEMSRLERWMAYLSPRTTDEERGQLAMVDNAIETAMEAENVFVASPEYLTAYERYEKRVRDEAAMKSAARKDGIAIGEARGEAKGRRAERNKLIIKLHNAGMSNAEIAGLVEADESEVASVIRKGEAAVN